MRVLFSSLAVFLVCAIAQANLDVSNYDKLYIRYHNCAWSPYNAGCGADNNGGDLWYLGLTQCFRANAAYSLYGVARGENDSGCTKATFINSYFTTAGVESFVETLQNAGVAVNQQGENQEEDGDEAQGEQLNAECQVIENENQDDQQAEENVDWSANNRKMYDGTTSYGLGCQGGDFAMKTFGGAYCDERSAVSVDNQLNEFNQDLEAAECVVIYDGSGQNDDNQAEDELDLLQNSEPCNVRFYPQSCPDPFGKLSFAARSVSRDVARLNQPVAENVKTAFSWILLSVGTLFIGMSAWALWNKSNNDPKLDLDEMSTGGKSARSAGWLSRKKSSGASTNGDSGTARKRRCRWLPFRR